jgi:hypothetical protein
MDTCKENILKKINTGEIDMKPRWYFVLQTTLLLVSLIIVSLVAIYFFSFILFFLEQTGLLFAPLFGLRGLGLFLISSPWFLISLVIVFLSLLYILVSRYSFSYRKPVIYSLLAIVLVVIVMSAFIKVTLVHEKVRVFVERHQVPGFAPLYQVEENERPAGMVSGLITGIIPGEGFIILNDYGEFMTVYVSPVTKQPQGYNYLINDKIVAFGDRHNNTLQAFGVQVIKKEKKRHLQNNVKASTELKETTQATTTVGITVE